MDHAELETAIHDFVVAAVNDHWKATGLAILLSDLGTKIRGEFPGSGEFLKVGLKNLLVRWPSVKQVTFPGVAERTGAIPSDATVPDNLEKIFRKRAVGASPSQPRAYIDDFWNAFFKPIENRRFVVIDGVENVSVLDDVSAPQSGRCFEVLADDLVGPVIGVPIHERVASTHIKIDAWLERNSLSNELFLKGKRYVGEREGFYSRRKVDKLFAVFGGLTPEDQGRIAIPLDILFKIAR
jgi:hypothetical protein